MFDAEKLLGSLISEGLGGRSRRGSGLKWQLGLGAVGVAMAAWEHFNRDGAAGSTQPPPPPQPPAPPAGPAARAMTPPPPPPPPAQRASPAPAGSAPAGAAAAAGDAVLLIRAMICAANADGRIDVDEQTRIVERLVQAGLGAEERAFLLRELATPPDPAALFAGVHDPLLADEIYVVSRLALTLDVDAEHAYLAQLAGRLGLSPARVAELELRCLSSS